MKQFGEFTVAQGLKPTIDGVIMPIAIENSILIGGLDRPSYMYIDASAARKSLILNKTVMGTAGNFGKLALQLARSLSLSKTVMDCGTKHYVHINIRDKKILKKFDSRYYLDEETGNLLSIKAKKDKHLIGKTIALRSPVTCALGNCVCSVCFGRTASLNFDIADKLTHCLPILKGIENNSLNCWELS